MPYAEFYTDDPRSDEELRAILTAAISEGAGIDETSISWGERHPARTIVNSTGEEVVKMTVFLNRTNDPLDPDLAGKGYEKILASEIAKVATPDLKYEPEVKFTVSDDAGVHVPEEE